MKGSKLVVIMSLLLLFVTGCFSGKTSSDEVTQQTTLSGESEHWQLEGYKLKIEGGTLFAGNGELRYKLDEEITDRISFNMVAEIDNKEIVLQGMKFVSSGRNFNKLDTGKAELKVPTNKEGKDITFLDKNNMYGVIEWMSQEGKRMKETIDFRTN